MVTKKQYIEALKNIVSRGGSRDELFYCSCCFRQEIKILTDLIEQHFDNPSLKYEELNIGMWVWDNQLKYFFHIVDMNLKIQGYETLKMFKVENYEGGSTLMIFEPNRFYRKEVQE